MWKASNQFLYREAFPCPFLSFHFPLIHFTFWLFYEGGGWREGGACEALVPVFHMPGYLLFRIRKWNHTQHVDLAFVEWQWMLDVESTLARWRSLSDRLHYDRYNMIVITIAVSSQLMNVNGPVRWHYHEWHSMVSKRRIFFHHWWTGWQCENVGWPRAIHRKWCCGKAWKPNVMNEVSVNKQNGTLYVLAMLKRAIVACGIWLVILKCLLLIDWIYHFA